jgi:hypothetical protein
MGRAINVIQKLWTAGVSADIVYDVSQVSDEQPVAPSAVTISNQHGQGVSTQHGQGVQTARVIYLDSVWACKHSGEWDPF